MIESLQQAIDVRAGEQVHLTPQQSRMSEFGWVDVDEIRRAGSSDMTVNRHGGNRVVLHVWVDPAHHTDVVLDETDMVRVRNWDRT